MLDLTSWSVREALAFEGRPMDAATLAARLDEPIAAIRAALSDLAHDGVARYCGAGVYVILDP